MLPDAIRVNSLKWQRSCRYFQKIRWRVIWTEIGSSGSMADPSKYCWGARRDWRRPGEKRPLAHVVDTVGATLLRQICRMSGSLP